MLELDFSNTPEKLRGDYSDMHKGNSVRSDKY